MSDLCPGLINVWVLVNLYLIAYSISVSECHFIF